MQTISLASFGGGEYAVSMLVLLHTYLRFSFKVGDVLSRKTLEFQRRTFSFYKSAGVSRHTICCPPGELYNPPKLLIYGILIVSHSLSILCENFARKSLELKNRGEGGGVTSKATDKTQDERDPLQMFSELY